LGKTSTFAHPNPKKTTSRWAKQAFLPIRARKNDSSLGKTGIFAHP
jgi:hypothetical protein